MNLPLRRLVHRSQLSLRAISSYLGDCFVASFDSLRSLRIAPRNNKIDIFAIVALALAPFIYFWQATFRQAVFFFGDILLFFYPTHLAYADALRQGRFLPLWEPRMFAGFPLYAEGQIAGLYPTHPILYGLLPVDVATNYDILINLAWVMIGTYLFLRALNLQPPSAFLGALTFGAGGFFMPRLQHMSVLATASWLPWLLWAWEKHEQATARRWRWWIVLALFCGIQLLGGHPQFALMSVTLWSLYAVVRWKRTETTLPNVILSEAKNLAFSSTEPDSSSQNPLLRMTRLFFEYIDLRRIVFVALAVMVGALIAAPQLLPTYELSTVSNRAAGLLPKFFNAFSLRPVHYAMLINPFLLGNPYPRVSVEVIGYVGILSLAFAVVAIAVKRDWRVVFFAAIAIVALLLGLGDQNPVYRGMRYLPLFNYFRVPSRFFFWYTFAVATLAAITFDYLWQRARATPQLTRGQKIALAFVALILAMIVGLVPALPIDFWLSLWVWLPLVFILSTAWIILGARRGLFTRTTLATLAIGLTAIDLALFASVYTKTYNLMVSVDDFYKPPSSLAVMKDLSPADGRVLTSLWIYPAQITMRESLYPNAGMSFGVASAGGYTPLVPQRASEYLDLEEAHERLTAPMLQLLNVRYYLVPQMLPVDAKTEGDDLKNPFTVDAVNRVVNFAPTSAAKLVIDSSLAQSVDWRDGDVVAEINLIAQDHSRVTIPLRAGLHTAEWAYERSDVRKVIKHSLPPIATTFPARSAFPTESHLGHNYRAQFDFAQDGKPLAITGISITPKIAAGLLHVERIALTAPDGKEISIAHLVGQTEQTLIYRTNEVAVFRNENPLPRAFLVHNARVLDDAATLREIRRADFKPAEQLYLAGGQLLNAGGAQRADESVRIVSYQPERVVLAVDAKTDAYVLLADAWYPGWVARVDGIETPVERADYIFRAVRVNAGTHQIEFEYRPMSLYVGIVLSVVGLVGLAGVFVIRRDVDV